MAATIFPSSGPRKRRIVAHKETVDVIVALNQDAVENHKHRLNPGGIILYDSKKADAEGVGFDFMEIVKEFDGKPIMRNTAAIGALAGVLNIEWSVLEKVIMDAVEKDVDLNLKIARHAYDRIENSFKICAKTGSKIPSTGFRQ